MITAAVPGFAIGETVALSPGVALPDWSLVADPEGRAALAASMAVAGRREKWAGLDAAEDRVRQAVLRSFARTGEPPAVAEIAAAAELAEAEARASLASLAQRDLLALDAAGGVAAAYPFSAAATPHRVTLRGGAARPVFALCAIDALGMGAMLGADAVVESACARCGAPVRVALGDRGRRLESVAPATAAVWSGIRYAGGCAARSGCLLKPFFCSPEHLEAWRAAHMPDGLGYRLSVAAAHEVGMALFAPMLAGPWSGSRKAGAVAAGTDGRKRLEPFPLACARGNGSSP